MNGLTHFDSQGNAVMVDVSDKTPTRRMAVAKGKIRVNDAVMEAVCTGTAAKGDVLGVARVGGIMGSKRTAELIPLCHPLAINNCTVDFVLHPEENTIEAVCSVKVSLLTVYDMCKAIDKTMTIEDVHLVRKEGGKSGLFVNEHD